MIPAPNIIALGGTGAYWPFPDSAALKAFLDFREGMAKGDFSRRVLFLVAPMCMGEVGTALARGLSDPASPYTRIFSRLISGDLEGVLPLPIEEIPTPWGRLNVVADWLVEAGATRELARLLEPLDGEGVGRSWCAVVVRAGLVEKPEEITGAVVVHLAELPELPALPQLPEDFP